MTLVVLLAAMASSDAAGMRGRYQLKADDPRWTAPRDDGRCGPRFGWASCDGDGEAPCCNFHKKIGKCGTGSRFCTQIGPRVDFRTAMESKPACCRAGSLKCLACAADMTPKEFCHEYPKHRVCNRGPTKPEAPKPTKPEAEKPDAQKPTLNENTDFSSFPTPRLRNVCRRMGLGVRGPRKALLARIATAIKIRVAKGQDPFKMPQRPQGRGHTSGYAKKPTGSGRPDMYKICQKTGNDMALRILCGKQSYAGKRFPKYYMHPEGVPEGGY